MISKLTHYYKTIELTVTYKQVNYLIITGWIAVQRNVMIDYDINTTPLEIRSDSELGSREEVDVQFYTSQEEEAGGVMFQLTSPPQYRMFYCRDYWTNFPSDLPTARGKVWRTTVIRSSGIIGLQILCNGEEVLNTVLSDSVCTVYSGSWTTYWNRDIAKISFRYHDTMSDYYRTYQPGN